jgi:hypothetical protein
MKGVKLRSKEAEHFSCEHWTMTDGSDMLLTGLLAADERAGGNSANGIRLADT